MRADYPRVTHPCATLLETEASFAFDLHVLSTPPAFNLSQNQTLQFKSVSRFLLGRNQNLKDSFFPLAIHLSMNHPRASAPCRPSRRRGADLCTIPLTVSTTFFSFRRSFFRRGLKRPKGVVQSREVEDIHPPPICQRFFVKKLFGNPEYPRKATHGNALRETILSPDLLPMAYRRLLISFLLIKLLFHPPQSRPNLPSPPHHYFTPSAPQNISSSGETCLTFKSAPPIFRLRTN